MIARRLTLFAIAISVLAAAGCSADITTGTRVPPGPTARVLLSDIVIPYLPSSYYHLDYDAAGRIVGASFGAGVTIYDVSYAGGRISEMRNNTVDNHDRLVYTYDNAGRVATVRYVDVNGVTYTVVVLTYDGEQLTGLLRNLLVNGQFIIDKEMTFSYYADANLRELAEHRPAIVGLQQEETEIDRFENYDNGINVDGFTLIHDDFFDHLVLLPQVQLQRGNPRHVSLQTRSGNGPFYTVDVVYTYTYDNSNRPLTKDGDVLLLNGPNEGQRTQTSSVFAYY